jgi:hypothetical protein
MPFPSPTATPAGCGQPWSPVLEGMNELHLNGSEPRIFPGVVMSRHRRGSQRQGSASEKDEGSAYPTRRSLVRGSGSFDGRANYGDEEGNRVL